MHHRRIVYIFRQGCQNNSYYSLFKRKPRVTMRAVADARTGEPIPLYETPDPFIFNFCLYGTERYIGMKLPLGGVVKMIWEWDDLEQAS